MIRAGFQIVVVFVVLLLFGLEQHTNDRTGFLLRYEGLHLWHLRGLFQLRSVRDQEKRRVQSSVGLLLSLKLARHLYYNQELC